MSGCYLLVSSPWGGLATKVRFLQRARTAADPKLTVAEAKSRGLLPGRTRRSGATLPPLAEPSDVRPPSHLTNRRLSSSVQKAHPAARGVGVGRLVERADAALYAAEQSGRNRVSMAN